MLTGSLPLTLALLTALLLLLLLAVLLLQGEDLTDCVVDSRGVHVRRYLLHPTPVKLLARLRSPALMAQVTDSNGTPLVAVASRDVPWSAIARVQLWPEKTTVLIYSPYWWTAADLPCTPFTYADTLAYIRDKIGRKKSVSLPPELIQPPAPKQPKTPPRESWQPPESVIVLRDDPLPEADEPLPVPEAGEAAPPAEEDIPFAEEPPAMTEADDTAPWS